MRYQCLGRGTAQPPPHLPFHPTYTYPGPGVDEGLCCGVKVGLSTAAAPLILLYLQAGIDTDGKDHWLCKNLQALLRFSGHYGDLQEIYNS